MLSLYPDFIKFPYFADPTERQVWGWQRQGEDNGDLMENSIIYYSFLPNAIFIVIETKSISCCFPSNKLLAKGPKGQLYSLWSSVLEFFPKPLNKKLVHILNYQCPPQKECLAILKGALICNPLPHESIKPNLVLGCFLSHRPNFIGPLIFLCTYIDTNRVLKCHS